MKNIVLNAIIIITSTFTLIGQPNTNIFKAPKSPDAAAFEKYGDLPVEYSTGVPSISVPLATIVQDELSLPISLSYHAGGVVLSESSTYIGQGWNLNGVGMISILKNGLKDDDAYGYFNEYHNVRDTAFIKDANLTQRWDGGNLDSEPDMYSFNFNGYSGKFMLDTARNAIIFPRSDLKINTIFVNNLIKGFQIVTPEGTIYHFGSTFSGSQNHVEYTFNSQGGYEISAFYLFKIESANKKHWIDISYINMTYIVRNPGLEYAYATACGTTNNIGYVGLNGSFSDTKFTTKVPSIITNSSNTTSISFNLSTTVRQDINGSLTDNAKSLSSIQFNNGIQCKIFNLFQSYFADGTTGQLGTKRLKLDSIRESSCNGSASLIIPATKFEYYGPIVNGAQYVGKTNSRNIDYWGYANGAGNDNVDINVPHTQGIQLNGGNRESNGTHMINGNIKKITYPTKASIEFEFEANTTPFPTWNINSTLMNIFSCFPTSPSTCCNTTVKTQNYTFTSIEEIENAYFDLKINLGPQTVCTTCNNIQNPSNVKIEILRGSVLVGERSINISSTCGSQAMINPPLASNFNNGSLNMFEPIQPNVVYTFRLTTGKGIGEFKLYTKTLSYVNKQVGGLRVKKITSHDGVNSANNIIKTYDYQDGSTTSGKMKWIPKWRYNTFNWPGTFLAPYAQLSRPFSEVITTNFKRPGTNLRSGHISYSKVTETIAGNGKKVMLFFPVPNIDKWDNELELPGVLNELEGKLQKETVYNESGVKLQETEFEAPEDLGLITVYPNLIVKRMDILGPCPDALEKKWPIFYELRTKAPYLIKKVTTFKDSVVTVENKHYDPTGKVIANPIATDITNSDGTVNRSEITYPYAITGNAAIAKLVERNIITPIITINKVNNIMVDGQKSSFKLYGTFPYLDSIYRYKTTWNSANSHVIEGWKLEQRIVSMDTTLGKPTTINVNGWTNNFVLEWFSGTALIKKQTFGAHIKEYTYHSGYGFVNRIKDIDGQFIDFTYDQLGRLFRKLSLPKISNPNPNVVSDYNTYNEYQYFYKTGSGDNNRVIHKSSFTPISGSSLSVLEDIQYIDGFGRKMQTVKKNQANGTNDLVVDAVVYDNKGRAVRKYLPYQSSNSNGAFVNIPTSHKFDSLAYESSPLNRVVATINADWHKTTTTYGTNIANEVTRWIGTTASNYDANSLYKVTTTDSSNRINIVYTDKMGRQVLSRQTKVGASANEITNTYTLYDDKNRVRTVLPPDATPSNTSLVFSYLYDGSDNMTWKQVPGKDPEIMIYNSRNLMTFYQDGNIKSATFNENGLANQWMMTKYDAYGRPLSTGFYTLNGTPAAENDLTTFTKQITSTSYGTTGINIGKVTQNRRLILGNYPNATTWIENNHNYDAFGRTRSVTGNNHLNTALDAQCHYYSYDFSGNILIDTLKHKTASGTIHTIINRNTFDFLGRLSTNHHKINTLAEQHILSNVYNFRGEVITKGLSLGLVPSLGVNKFLQKIDYQYNTQGWLIAINGPLSTGQPNGSNEDLMDVFYQKINYDNGFTTVTGQTVQSDKSGNISQMLWQNRGGLIKGYNFEYDFLNRVTAGKYFDIYSGTTPGTYSQMYNEMVNYDKRGNISSLTRNTFDDINGALQIDNLTYTYNSASNQLSKIADASNNAQGFNINGALSSATYTYDLNGSLRTDPYKKITSINYYYNNLPKEIVFNFGVSNINRIRFTYDAMGTKLRKQVLNNSGTVTAQQDYVDGIEYNNNVIEAIYHSAGRSVWTGSTWRYEFNVTDHLGNVRAVISDLNNDKILNFTNNATSHEIINSFAQYPFGMAMANDGAFNNTLTPDTKYRYNGKELNEDLGLNMYDYGARFYDPAVGRWGQIDPLASKFNSWSPYHFATNNPINVIDYDGRDTIPAQSRVTPLPVRPTSTVTPQNSATTASGLGGTILQRILGVVGLMLTPANGNMGPMQTTPVNNVDRYTTDPSQLSDEYLAGVRQRIENGTATQQDYIYAKEAFSRTQSNESDELIYKPSFKHGLGGFGTYMDLDNLTAQIVLNSSVLGGKQRYGYSGGKIYEFQPDNTGTYHGYPIPGEQAGSKVLKTLRDNGFFNQKTFDKLRKQSSL
jgi:RHS repeat-associated protein